MYQDNTTIMSYTQSRSLLKSPQELFKKIIVSAHVPTFTVAHFLGHSVSLFCRLKQIYQAIQNEYETKLAIERTKTKKLQLKIKNLQEDLNLVVCV